MGKKLKLAKEKLDQDQKFSIKKAISLIKQNSFAKFNETLEVAIKLNVNVKRSEEMVRGVVSLPFGIGKNIKVAVFCKADRSKDAISSGADMADSEAIITNVRSGSIDFDTCIATPDMMGIVGQLARVLGPKGLMPNPKLGTVTNDIHTAIKNAKNGQVEYRTEKAGIIHAGVGKISFSEHDLRENLSTVINSVLKAKPPSIRGNYIQKISLCSTMGPSLKIDIATIT